MTENVFAEIKCSLSAERVVSHFLGSARRHTWHCPFHEDKTPSLSAYGPAIRCFGCQWSGDIFKFIQQYCEVNLADALKIAADLAGVILPERERDKGKVKTRLRAKVEELKKESREIAKEIEIKARLLNNDAWRKAWDLRNGDGAWDAVEMATRLDRIVERM